MTKEIGPREKQLRELAEARALSRSKPNLLSPPPKQGLRIKSRQNKAEPIGDGVALTSAAMPPGLIEKTAKAIKRGKLSLKRPVGRPKVEGERPWEKEGIPRRTWYRRQAEKVGK